MAGGMDLGTSKGNKKPLDAALNLVPFIDLMAVTIAFLIMTAVWTQLGRLQVSQAGQSPEGGPVTETVPITLLLTERELKLTVGATTFDAMPLVRDSKGRLEVTKLTERLKDLKGQDATRSNLTLQTEDGVHYDDLVRVIDTCIGSEFPSVSVTGTN